MGLLSFLKSKSGDAPKASPSNDPADAVQQARTRARQRLIGAAVLVVAGVIGFPLLFATQPRPLPVDTPIEMARREATSVAPQSTHPAPSANTASAPVPGGMITESAADAGRELPPPTARAPEPVVETPPPSPVAVPPERKPVEKPADKPVEKPAAKPAKPPEAKPAERKPADKPAAKPADAGRAQALLNGEAPSRADKSAAAEKAKADEAGGRFIVQVGAFGEMAAAREARQKVEKLGLKTYTQVVETSAGSRIRVRVGPFASRADAEKAAAKIKTAGLGSAVFTL